MTALIFAILPAWGQAPTQAIPNFSPDANTSWLPDRAAGDDYLPPESGPGPVLSDPAYPYIPNDEYRNTGVQPTFRVADLTNPILQPWVREQMKKATDEVLAGGVPFVAREHCWPAGVPAFDIMRRAGPFWVIQSSKEVHLIWSGGQEVRHIYLNVPHSQSPKPSWYGESVGYYEGDELVVDTIGLNDKTFVDNYGTPHTTQLHVVERFKLIEGGETLQVLIEVEDPGAFTTKWRAMQRFKLRTDRSMAPWACAENNFDYITNKNRQNPQAEKSDF